MSSYATGGDFNERTTFHTCNKKGGEFILRALFLPPSVGTTKGQGIIGNVVVVIFF